MCALVDRAVRAWCVGAQSVAEADYRAMQLKLHYIFQLRNVERKVAPVPGM